MTRNLKIYILEIDTVEERDIVEKGKEIVKDIEDHREQILKWN